MNITTGSMSIILRSSWTDLKLYLCIRAAKKRNNSDNANDRPKQSRLPEKRKLHWFVGQVIDSKTTTITWVWFEFWILKSTAYSQCPKTDFKKGPYLDQRLPYYESLYPIGQIQQELKSCTFGTLLINKMGLNVFFCISKNQCSGTRIGGSQVLMILDLCGNYL